MKALRCTILLGAALVSRAEACDLCSIYFASQARGEMGQGFLAGAAEQWTHYGTVQQDGREVPNPVGQEMDSSVSQLFVGYNFNERFGVQFNLPFIDRWYTRPIGLGIERGSETGIGDASLVGHMRAYRHETELFTINWNLLAGLKFPTGSTARLKEEFNETEIPGAPLSGIHGHDLTLGSGSWDGVVGTALFVRWKRAFWTANVQYSIRSEGGSDYQRWTASHLHLAGETQR